MPKVSESIFNGNTCTIPLAEVAYIEKSKLSDEICVVMKGSQHPTDQQGNYMSGYGRADCPYISGEEASAFLQSWTAFRHERDDVIGPDDQQASGGVNIKPLHEPGEVLKAYDALFARYKALGAEKELLVNTMQEALDNCEICRHLPKGSPGRCARCQTFINVLAEVDPAEETQSAPTSG